MSTASETHHDGSFSECATESEALTSTEVLQEILYRYSALRRMDLARDVYDLFVEICPTVVPITLADTDRARDILVAHPDTGAVDALDRQAYRRALRLLAGEISAVMDITPKEARAMMDAGDDDELN